MSIEHLDIEDLRLVGYVNFMPRNAKIEVLGYMQGRKIKAFSTEEAMQLFPPDGDVFAFNFERDHKPEDGHFVSFYAKESKKSGEDDYRYAKYEINYSERIDTEIGVKLRVLTQMPTDNGEYNYKIFEEHGTFSSSQPLFIRAGDRIYHYKPDSNSRLLDWWNISKVDLLSCHGHTIVVNDGGGQSYDGQIDLTTDEQLINWFLSKVVEAKWEQIWKDGKFENVTPVLRDIFDGMKNLPSEIIESRMMRLVSLTKSFNIGAENVKKIANAPWLMKTVEKTINDNKAEFFKEYSSELSDEIEKLQEDHALEIEKRKEQLQREYNRLNAESQEKIKELEQKQKDCEDKIQNAQSRLETLQKEEVVKRLELDNLEKNIMEVEKRKDDIVKDFTVVRDVLGIGIQNPPIIQENTTTALSVAESIDISDEPLADFEDFIDSLRRFIKNCKIKDEYKIHIKAAVLLAKYNVVLVPHNAVINAILHASGKCKYIIEPVYVNWKTFDDLWQNGLEEIVFMSSETPGIMHYLVLQNINMSYIPTYMQPLINMQNGMSSFFPHTQIGFPNNLRILCTITDEEVIPLSKQCMSNIGCVDKGCAEGVEDKINLNKVKINGYLTPGLIYKVSQDNEYDVENQYQTYIDE